MTDFGGSKMILKQVLEQERDNIIFSIHTALQNENFNEITYLLGRLIQTQDLILQSQDVSQLKQETPKQKPRTKTENLNEGDM
jgi:hypothetical protein